jgi:hypothetical protein
MSVKLTKDDTNHNPNEITAFAALQYLRCGFSVQPLELKSKMLVYDWMPSYTPNDLKRPDTSARLAKDFYNRGIALWMGQTKGRFVTLDFDDPAVYHAWAAANPGLATTATAMTPGGGYHVVVRFNVITPNCGKSDHYVDIISDGWYIAAWPSVHPNGGIYQWLKAPWDGIAEVDYWKDICNGLDLKRITFDVPDYDDQMERERDYYDD